MYSPMITSDVTVAARASTATPRRTSSNRRTAATSGNTSSRLSRGRSSRRLIFSGVPRPRAVRTPTSARTRKPAISARNARRGSRLRAPRAQASAQRASAAPSRKSVTLSRPPKKSTPKAKRSRRGKMTVAAMSASAATAARSISRSAVTRRVGRAVESEARVVPAGGVRAACAEGERASSDALTRPT